MEESSWDIENIQTPTVKIDGEMYDLDIGRGFADVVIEFGKMAGYKKVRVFIIEDGVEEEVEIDDAPETVTAGMEIVIRPYEKAA